MINVYEFVKSDNPKLKYKIPKNVNLNGIQYSILKQIGGGGESFVFEVTVKNSEEGKSLALKVCKTQNKVNAQTQNVQIPDKKFKNEILVAKEFSPKGYKRNFITYYFDGFLHLHNKNDTSKKSNHSFYVMDLADESLEDYLCKRMSWDDEREILPKIKNLADTLQLLHQKEYVHRDIKPQNILVQGELFRLADFGMVEKENESCTKTGPKYWPTPELLNMCDNDIHCSGKQTDVFMLGCIFYFIYTKKYPVGNIDINLIDNCYKMKPIIEKMISYQIVDRHQNGEEVYNEVNAIRFDE